MSHGYQVAVLGFNPDHVTQVLAIGHSSALPLQMGNLF